MSRVGVKVYFNQGIRLVRYLMEHLGINGSNYFKYKWVRLSYKVIHEVFFLNPKVLLFLDLREFARLF